MLGAFPHLVMTVSSSGLTRSGRYFVARNVADAYTRTRSRASPVTSNRTPPTRAKAPAPGALSPERGKPVGRARGRTAVGVDPALPPAGVPVVPFAIAVAGIAVAVEVSAPVAETLTNVFPVMF